MSAVKIDVCRANLGSVIYSRLIIIIIRFAVLFAIIAMTTLVLAADDKDRLISDIAKAYSYKMSCFNVSSPAAEDLVDAYMQERARLAKKLRVDPLRPNNKKLIVDRSLAYMAPLLSSTEATEDWCQRVLAELRYSLRDPAAR